MARSKTKLASSKKSIQSAANCGSPSPFSAVQRRWNSNTGRSNAVKIDKHPTLNVSDGKGSSRTDQTANLCGPGEPGSSGGNCIGPARSQYHGVLQGI